MQFRGAHAEVETEGFAERAKFSIAASGKAFKGLIDGLYSRKIEAVVRELSTNAFDSHKAAASIAPFETHLPNALEPTFYIRDFGTGMSHDFMMKRFTVMFDSTKDGLNSEDGGDPNEQVGMLGLGRMSFFAYTDSCTITVWQNGEARYYTVFMGADGIPDIAFAGQHESDEPTGVKVEFPVNMKDMTQFEKAACRVYKGFPILPVGLPDRVVEDIQTEPEHIGSFWRSFPDDYLPDGGFWARQGCVLYPIDLGQIDDAATTEEKTFWDSKTLSYQTRMVTKLSSDYAVYENMDATFVIDFPIGALDFDLGRERLAYNDDTVAAIRKRWDEFLADVNSFLDKEFAGATTDWEYLCAGVKIDFQKMGPLFQQTHHNRRLAEISEKLRVSMADKRSTRSFQFPLAAIVSHDPSYLHDYNIAYDRNYHMVEELLRYRRAPDLEKSVFVIEDVNKITGKNKRVVRYLEENDLLYAFMVRAKSPEATEEFLLEAGSPPTVNLSDLPLPERTKAPSAPRERYPFERLKHYDESINYIEEIEEGTDLSNYVFLFMNRGQVYNPDPETYPSLSIYSARNHARVLRQFFNINVGFINLRKSEMNKLEKWAHLPLLYDLLPTLVDDLPLWAIRKVINVANQRNFSSSIYDSVLDDWGQLVEGEVKALKRFDKRAASVSGMELLAINVLDNPATMPRIIDRALEAGFEVLPTPDSNGKLPYRLLSSKGERLVKLLAQVSIKYRGNRKLIYKAMKEFAEC